VKVVSTRSLCCGLLGIAEVRAESTGHRFDDRIHGRERPR